MMNILKALFLILFINPAGYGQTSDLTRKNIQVSEIGVEEINSIIENREGKTLLINIWATWCVPCKEEFPDLIKFAESYNDKVEVIGISIDYPDEVESKIIPFLNKLKPSFVNYVNKEFDTEKFINNLNQEWSGAIPATFFYDLNGDQYLFYEGKMTFSEIETKAFNILK